ncbi:hypothetical protein JTE90_019821 [Oedothorax gibbosus]|uniref:TIR domain-containing protein n=1 Tax=Oedothorax gibbosus TaxID=931172 RepID=A0AAV6V6P5_9ARAC|nr:hypothetical protein JTE90_019821 [Oedothorax gibbosus]
MPVLLIWVLIVHLFKESTQIDCKRDVIKDAIFDCKFRLNSMESNLECESSFHEFESQQSYFVLQLHRFENNFSDINTREIFKSFLEIDFDSNSKLYSCDVIWRDFIAGNPEVLSENCKRYDECVKQIPTFINGSNVNTVEVHDIEGVKSVQGLDVFPRVTEVSIENIHFINASHLTLGYQNKLKRLILKNDSINYLPDGMFAGLRSLEFLDLSQNKITTVKQSLFGKLENLTSLNLSVNAISEFSHDAFNAFPNLQEIYLTNNDLSKLDENLFSINERLIKIDLSYNNIKDLPEQIFKKLNDLEQVSCSRCQLIKLHSNLFLNKTKLKSINFSKNYIATVPSDLLIIQHYLFHISLSDNRISEMPLLLNKTYLKYLDLSQNEITSLDENLSKAAVGLYYFDISNNRLKALVDSHVKYFKDLEYFDLSRNNISFVQLGTTSDVFIRKLRLSDNFITTFNFEWRRFVYLEELIIENNKLTHIILPPCIRSIKHTITFYFQNNKISTLDASDMIRDQNRTKSDRTMASGCYFNGLSKNFVDLSNNPLVCDCTLYPFYNYLKHEKGVKLNTFLNLQNTRCFSPMILKNRSVDDLTNNTLSCYFTKDCPKPCICGVRGKDNRTFVNCSATGLNEAPRDIPIQTTVLYFKRNKISEVPILNINTWGNLVELHLDYNRISTLEGWEIPERLRYLSLRGNKLKNLPQPLMNFIHNQSNFELFFSGNDKHCDCSRKPLQKFLNENEDFVKDIKYILCKINTNGTTSHLPLNRLPGELLCPRILHVNFDSKATIISMCVVFVILLSLLLFYYKQRQLIMSFLYMYCNEVFHVCFEENDADDDKVFDAFVAYSSSDRSIVMDILEELEKKEPYFQLCIHERNWLPGRFVSDNIVSSVQNSKRTIVLLSSNFIASPWFRLELRAAIFKVSGDRKNKIIVILVDKSTSLEGIDTELRHVISKRTYLVWGERWFWEKLRYAMPRKSCLDNSDETMTEDISINEMEGDIALLEDV